jgi:hypothetical protein
MLPLVLWYLLTDVSQERRPDGGDGKFSESRSICNRTTRSTSQKPNYFYFLVLIGPPPPEVCDSPDQVAHYHTLGPKTGAWPLTRHLDGRSKGSVGLKLGITRYAKSIDRRCLRAGCWEIIMQWVGAAVITPLSETLILLPLQWT